MNYKYTRTPWTVRMIACLLLLLLVVICIAPAFTSCSDTTENTSTEPTLVTSEPTNSTEATVVTEPEPERELVSIPAPPEYPEVDKLSTIYDVSDAISLCDDHIQELEDLLADLSEEHPQYQELTDQLKATTSQSFIYTTVLSEHWYRRDQERPVMTQIWNYLTHTAGFSHEVAAGIIGNMSAESGGCGYDDIMPSSLGESGGRYYYGVCQWSVIYHPEIIDTSLQFQLDYLNDSYEYLITYYSSSYSKRYGAEFGLEQFLDMKDPYEAAIAFAVCYERCHKNHVEHRGPLAEKAYTYFTVLGSWPWPGPEPTID